MKVRKARIVSTATIITMDAKIVKLSFDIQFGDNKEERYGIDFNTKDTSIMDSFYLLLQQYSKNNTIWLDDLEGNDILVLLGKYRGIAFSKPNSDIWIVLGESKLYSEDKARKIIACKNQSK